MLETIADWLSFGILLLFPIVIVWLLVHNFLNKRKNRKREEIGKFYREW